MNHGRPRPLPTVSPTIYRRHYGELVTVLYTPAMWVGQFFTELQAFGVDGTAAIGADESTPSSLICRPIVFRAAFAMGQDERRWLAWASQGKEVGLRSDKVTNKRPHLPQLGAAVQSDHRAGVAPPLIRVVWVREAQAICKSARRVNHFPSPVPAGASAR